MYFTKATRTREIYLIERKSYFLRRVASSNRVSPLGSPNRNAKFRVTSVLCISLGYKAMFRRSSLSRLYFDYCTRIRSCISIYRLLPISAYRVRIKNAARCVQQISSNLCSNLRRDVKNNRSFECWAIISTGNLHVYFFHFLRTFHVLRTNLISNLHHITISIYFQLT